MNSQLVSCFYFNQHITFHEKRSASFWRPVILLMDIVTANSLVNKPTEQIAKCINLLRNTNFYFIQVIFKHAYLYPAVLH